MRTQFAVPMVSIFLTVLVVAQNGQPQAHAVASPASDAKPSYEFSRALQGKDIPAMAFSPDGSLLAVAGEPALKLWNVETGGAAPVLTGHADNTFAACLRPRWQANRVGERGRRHQVIVVLR